MDKREIIETGFRRGYRLYQEVVNPEANHLPDCPFPLRTAERSLWLRAWGIGKALARMHRVDAEAALAEFVINIEEEA